MLDTRLIAVFIMFTVSHSSLCVAQDVDDGTNAAETVELIIQWNEALYDVAEEFDGFLSLKGVRVAAMMHKAIYDVVDHTRLATHSASADGNGQIDWSAAVSEAAYTVASREYPDYAGRFSRLRTRGDGTGHTSATIERSLTLGEKAGIAAIQSRAGDNWDAEAEYLWHPMSPGVYAEFSEHSNTPQGFVFGSGWAKARPFILPTPDHFRSPPPPPLESREYYEAFSEVKEVGAFQSPGRTLDQSHLAIWWKDFAENSHNRLARSLVDEEELGALETARLFALINMAIFDAYVNVFDNKFHYNHWRPYTAIRMAESDGNKWTEPDSLWTNLHNHTYAFPSYPSAHGTACAAAMSIFADVFGDNHAFTMSNPVVDLAGPFSGKIKTNPPTRSFNAFSEAALECSMSRVYLGIHFRYDSVEGFALGNRIGDYILDHALTREGE